MFLQNIHGQHSWFNDKLTIFDCIYFCEGSQSPNTSYVNACLTILLHRAITSYPTVMKVETKQKKTIKVPFMIDQAHTSVNIFYKTSQTCLPSTVKKNISSETKVLLAFTDFALSSFIQPYSWRHAHAHGNLSNKSFEPS
jgi:hypothetical protein